MRRLSRRGKNNKNTLPTKDWFTRIQDFYCSNHIKRWKSFKCTLVRNILGSVIEVASVNSHKLVGRVVSSLLVCLWLRGNWVLPTEHKGNLPSRGVALLAGGRPSQGFRRPPTSSTREVALVLGGQNPIALEYQIYLPAVDTLVTGMGSVAHNRVRFRPSRGP